MLNSPNLDSHCDESCCTLWSQRNHYTKHQTIRKATMYFWFEAERRVPHKREILMEIFTPTKRKKMEKDLSWP